MSKKIKSIKVLSCFFAAGLLFSGQVWAVNVNEATAEELADELNGVGPALADKIIAYREENGPFETIEDLTSVKGIGKSIAEKNMEVIQFSDDENVSD